MRPVLVIEDDETEIEAIREGFRRDFPTIVFTDHQTEKSRHAAYESGANAYVMKPSTRDKA